VRLTRAGRDVREVRVVVKHHGAVMLGDRRGQQIDDSSGPVLAPGRHPDWTSRSCSMRRRRLTTNSSAALTVSFFVVVSNFRGQRQRLPLSKIRTRVYAVVVGVDRPV